MKFKSLRSRIAAHVALLVAGSLLIGVTAAAGIMSLHEDMGVAVRGYRELRQVYEVGVHVAAARQAETPPAAAAAIDAAIVQLQTVSAYVDDSQAPMRWLDESLRHQWIEKLQRARRELDSPYVTHDLARSTLNQLLGELANISATVRRDVAAREASAEHDRHIALRYVSIFSIAIVIAGAIVGVRLYRRIVQPLDCLSDGVRSFTSGKLDERVSINADREFASLAKDFNTMAAELQSLYANLEARVAAKSRQLVRSERLANVGYLAAGVAHEINNPLGIIAGYGERSLQRLDRADDPAASDYVRNAIGVMCDEAFRCKKITDRLLMLARPGEEARRIVSMSSVAGEVVTLLGGLERFIDRRITLEADPAESFSVFGNEGELRQVLLNLLVNALESFTNPSQAAHVHVAILRLSETMEITITDNGRGMSPDTLSRIFEPFFTEKRAERAGTGLGLAVAHSIIADHNGRIDAHSDGPGAGSTFVVRLPAHVSEAAHAAAR